MPSFNPIMVEGYAALSSCTAVVQASGFRLNDGFDVKLGDCLWLDPPLFNSGSQCLYLKP